MMKVGQNEPSIVFTKFIVGDEVQKQSSKVALRKRCSINIQQFYSRTLMLKCDFNKVACNFIEIGMDVFL